VGGWLRRAERLYARHEVALGQVATTAHDEALYLLLRTLGLPLDSRPAVLRRKLTPDERARVAEVFRRRVEDRVPAAYLTHEAWLGGQRFYGNAGYGYTTVLPSFDEKKCWKKNKLTVGCKEAWEAAAKARNASGG